MTVEEFVIDFVRNYFDENKIKYKNEGRFDTWLSRYFNFRLKFITPQKRRVIISKELKETIINHPALFPFFTLLHKADKGDDLNIYQSKDLFNSDAHDDLFNDWGLHHLHLETEVDKNSNYFVKRAHFLLFAKFTNDNAYFINVYKHQEKPLWGKKDLIGIIQNNWEYLIKRNEMRGKVYSDLDDNQIEVLRRKGFTGGVNVNGKGYLMLGDGYATSGMNMSATGLSGEVARWIFKNQSLFESDKELFKQKLLYELYLE